MATGHDLKLLIKGRGYTAVEAAPLLGVSRPTLQAYFKQAHIDDVYLQNVKEKLPVKTGEARAQPEKVYQKIGQKGIETVQEQEAEYLPRTKNTANTILHVPIMAEAGFIGGDTDPVTNEELQPWALPGFDDLGYSFTVKGPSMMPTLKEGDTVVTSRRVEQYETIRREYIYVIVTEENILIKRVKINTKDHGTLHLISDNPEFKETTVKYDDVKIYKVRRNVSWDLSKRN